MPSGTSAACPRTWCRRPCSCGREAPDQPVRCACRHRRGLCQIQPFKPPKCGPIRPERAVCIQYRSRAPIIQEFQTVWAVKMRRACPVMSDVPERAAGLAEGLAAGQADIAERLIREPCKTPTFAQHRKTRGERDLAVPGGGGASRVAGEGCHDQILSFL